MNTWLDLQTHVKKMISIYSSSQSSSPGFDITKGVAFLVYNSTTYTTYLVVWHLTNAFSMIADLFTMTTNDMKKRRLSKKAKMMLEIFFDWMLLLLITILIPFFLEFLPPIISSPHDKPHWTHFFQCQMWFD